VFVPATHESASDSVVNITALVTLNKTTSPIESGRSAELDAQVDRVFVAY